MKRTRQAEKIKRKKRLSVKVEVRYWLGKLTKEERERIPFVTSEDRKKAEKFLFERDKTEHLVSAYFKRKYIGVWEENAYGKPIADNKFFNVSHSDGIVVFVRNDKFDIGVDVEKVKCVEKSFIEYVTTDEERATVKTERDFFEIWTAKESLVKANGNGISGNIKNIPAMPLNGKKNHNEETYAVRTTVDGEYVLSVTVKTEEEIDLEIIKELLK